MTETATLTLSDFLLARIAADEGVARGGVDQTYPGIEPSRLHDQLRTGVFRQPGPVIISRARVLAECEAKRRLIEIDGKQAKDKGIFAALALPYADHPDFREEWRVS